MTATFAYDSEGKLLSQTYPTLTGFGVQPMTIVNSYDTMSRLSSVSGTEQNGNAGNIQGCTPTYMTTPLIWARPLRFRRP